MGYYLPGPPKGKVPYLCSMGATLLDASAVTEITDEKRIICVVDNGPFEAAALIHNMGELAAFSRPDDDRPRVWLLMDRAQADRLAGLG